MPKSTQSSIQRSRDWFGWLLVDHTLVLPDWNMTHSSSTKIFPGHQSSGNSTPRRIKQYLFCSTLLCIKFNVLYVESNATHRIAPVPDELSPPFTLWYCSRISLGFWCNCMISKFLLHLIRSTPLRDFAAFSPLYDTPNFLSMMWRLWISQVAVCWQYRELYLLNSNYAHSPHYGGAHRLNRSGDYHSYNCTVPSEK
jgi:hypothetical protein